MAEAVSTTRRRAVGAQGLAYLALILAIVALVLAISAQQKASQAGRDATHAVNVSRDAQTNANKALNGNSSTSNTNNVVLPTGGGQ